MQSREQPTTLRSAGQSVLADFHNVSNTLKTMNDDQYIGQVPPAVFNFEYDKFRLWSVSIGLLAEGEISFEHHLGNNKLARDYVLITLKEISENLVEMEAVLSGSRPPYENAEDHKREGKKANHVQDPASGQQRQHGSDESKNQHASSHHEVPQDERKEGDVEGEESESMEDDDDDATSVATSDLSDDEPFHELVIEFNIIKDRVASLHSLDGILRSST